MTFREEVREWCRAHVPPDWRRREDDYATFQHWWFRQLHQQGWAVPHWPAQWGGGMSVADQVVLYEELAAHDAPRLSLAFVSIHHAAATLLAFGTDEQKQRHLPGITDGEIWVQGFSEPEAGSDLAALRTSARRHPSTGSGQAATHYVVNGQKLWASGAQYADWCLLLVRTDPDAPKRKGISFLIMDMRSPGVEVRPIRQATGESHFCEIFLTDVRVPVANLIGPENQGWQVAQATLGAERGLTMLELAERLGNAGFRWLRELCAAGLDARTADRLAQFEIELSGLRALCSSVVARHETGTAGPVDASIVKLYYSELLQRMTGFGAEVAGLAGLTQLTKPASSGWESGNWALDFIGSWEWTIPGGASEIQRNIIAERGLGLPREPEVAR